MAQQTILTSENEARISLETFLGIGSFFLDTQNRSQKFDNYWTFEKIDSLLRDWAVRFDPELKTASFEEVLKFLQQLSKEEITETTVPTSPELEQLTEQAKKAEESLETTKQKAVAEAEKAIREIYLANIKRKLVEKLTQSPVPAEQRTKIAGEIAEELKTGIKESDLPVLNQKLENTPEESTQHQQLEQQIYLKFTERWERTVKKVVSSNNLSPEQEKYLTSLNSPILEYIKPIETWNEIIRQRQQLNRAIVKEISTAVPSEKTNEVAEIISDTLVQEQSFQRGRILSVTPEERTREVQNGLEKTVGVLKKNGTLSAIEAQKLSLSGKKVNLTGIAVVLDNIRRINEEQTAKIGRILAPSLSEERANLVASEIVKTLPDNLTAAGIEQAAIASVWQMVGGEITLQPQEAIGVITAVSGLSPQEAGGIRSFALVKIANTPKGNPFSVSEKTGKSIIETARAEFAVYGLNRMPESIQRLTVLKRQFQSLWLAREGIQLSDIDAAIEKMSQASGKDVSVRQGSSLQLKEFREIRKFYEEFLQKAEQSGFPIKQIQKWRENSISPVKIILSKLKLAFGKTGLSGKIKTSLFQNIRAGFLNSSLGAPIKFAMEKSAQKSLQFLWSGGKEGFRKVAVPFMQKILVAFGVGAKAALVAATNIIGVALLVVPGLLGKAKDFFKNIFSSGTKIFGSILSGMTGSGDTPEDKEDSKMLIFIFSAVFLFIFLGVFIDNNIKKTSMIPPREIRYTSRIPPSAIKPNCINLENLFKSAAESECVPTSLIMAISRVEASGIWGMDCNQVAKYSSDRWWEQATEEEKEIGYCYDTCAATGLCESRTTVMGPMQFEQATWQGYMPNPPYTLMDRCRLDLSIQAAAKKLKANSGTNTETCSNWNETTVRQVAERYCGACRSRACGEDYCGIVWILYQQYANQ